MDSTLQGNPQQNVVSPPATMQQNTTKKQRLNNSIAKSSSSLQSSIEVGLPSELWAHVMQFVSFDEVIKCTAINKSFLDVPKLVKKLHICSGESMDVSPEAIERFSSVEGVDICVIRKIINGITDFHLDVVAMEHIVPFLSRLPNLKWCRLDSYDVREEQTYDHPQSNAKWRDLIASVCKAYKTGKISEVVQFDGLIPYNDGGHDRCAWMKIPKLDSYRDDVCQVCDMLSNSLPPLQLLETNNEFIPCMSYSNIAKIVRFRDEDRCQSTMTAAIVNEIPINWDFDSYHLMSPPDFVTRECKAMSLYDHHFERLECLIANGGNPNDTTIISDLLDKRRYSSEHFLGRRRIVELETYNKLKSLGCDMKEDDFLAVDRADKRTDVELFQARKLKSQLNSGVAICDIEEVQDRIKRILGNGEGGNIMHNGRLCQCSDLTVKDVMDILSGWLEIDLSDYRDGIQSYVSSLRTAWLDM